MRSRLSLLFRLPDSRVPAGAVSRSERILGHFLGPCLAAAVFSGTAGPYLMQFYTDVLGLSGVFLALLPLFSRLLAGITSLWAGRLIDRTRTRQGRARPYVLAAGPLLAVGGALLYAVPRISPHAQLIWVVVSYSFFFSLAWSVYSVSHSLMVPLSTRNIGERDSLSVLSSASVSILPGLLTNIVLPLLIRRMGVGAEAQNEWLSVMGMLSAAALPAALTEYLFTRERVADASAVPAPAFRGQLSACFRNRFWVMILLFALLSQFCSALSSSSMLYYCNWVLGRSVETGARMQILVNAIGQAPLGVGAAFLDRLTRRFGKRRTAATGFALAGAGGLIVLLGGESLPVVLAGLFIRSVGLLPTYLCSAFLAEALDRVEAESGFRADGFSASILSILQTALPGLSQSMLLLGMNRLGYITPGSAQQAVLQPDALRLFFSGCFALLPMLCCLMCSLTVRLCPPEKCAAR